MGINYQINHVPSLGKGSVLFDRFLNGNPTSVFMHLGNCSKFSIEPKDDKAELFQSLYPTPTMFAQAVKKRDLKITIEGTDFSADHAQLFSIAGGVGTRSQTGAAQSAEVVISAAQTTNCLGRYFQVVHYPIATWTDLKQGASTLVNGTDYVVLDLTHGIIYVPLTSAISTAGTTAVTADYTSLTSSVSQISGHTVNFVQGHILFIPDPADGPNIQADVWRVNLTQNGKIGLIVDEYNNWVLEGSALDDTANHATAPFYQLTYL
jgi:hypothetical protein